MHLSDLSACLISQTYLTFIRCQMRISPASVQVSSAILQVIDDTCTEAGEMHI